MNNDAVIKKLTKLVQLDIDAARAYEQALDKIDMADIHLTISQFRDDHLRHIENLSQEIRALGGTPPEKTPDLKGLLIEGFTALRSITGIEGALKAMRSNEKLTNSTYDNALEENELPANTRTLLINNRDDERRHLAYIERVLAEAPWKTKATA